jgi:transposase-like protein
MAMPQSRQHSGPMATHSPLRATIGYLRFPFSPDHRAPVQKGDSCPHCAGRRIQKWGTFSGRQRFRCRRCERTFSTFTGTALTYLKHPERWCQLLWCVDGRLTVRASAEVLGVNKDTALRWRHRLLAQWRREPRFRLTGSIVVGDFCMPHSAKGSRLLTRPARRHGEPWSFPFDQTGPVTVLVARARPGVGGLRCAERLVIERVAVDRRLRSADYDAHLAPRLREVTEIAGCQGASCSLAAFARREGAAYLPLKKSFFPTEVFVVRRELRVWLRPFRGVASHRLDHYLEWFRRRGWSRGSPNTSRRQS